MTNLPISILDQINPPLTMPRTAGWPVVGSLPAFLRDPFPYLEHARAEHGDIFKLNLGLTDVIVCAHPDHVQHILRDNAQNYHKAGPLWNMVRTLLGNGLVVSEGEVWRRQRRLMQPSFHRQHLTGLTDTMVTAIDEVLTGWAVTGSRPQSLDLMTGFSQVTMRVIMHTMFGTGMSTREMDDVGEAMSFILDYMIGAIVTDALPGWLPLPGKRRFRQALARFDEVVYRIIEESRQVEEPQNHLLAMLMNAVDAETGEGMSTKQLRDEVATIFLAGYETTSISLAWATHILAEQPDIQAKVQAEVEACLGDRQPTFADLPRLAYTRMVIQEAIRVRPPVWFLPRVAANDDEIGGYAIPAGSQVMSMNYLVHHHPDFWPEPHVFNPERFSPEQETRQHRFAWVPFGAGQRMCVGRDFALMESQLALAMLVQRFEIAAAPGASPILKPSTTLRTRQPLKVMMRPRY